MVGQFFRLLSAWLLLFGFGSAFAQQLLPVPRATIELLSNVSFEMDNDGDKLPDGWSGKNTTALKADKLKCDKPDKLVAHSGTCAFMFRGNPAGGKSKLQQTISDTSTLVNGMNVTFSVYLDASSGVPGTTIGKAKLTYSDGTSVKLSLAIPNALERGDYQLISNTHMINMPEGLSVSQAKVHFRYKSETGKFLIDDASLAVSTTDATATSTDQIVSTETLTLTLLPSSTAIDTATPTKTPDTPTGTELPTDLPTQTTTATFTSTLTDTPTTTALPTNTATSTPTHTFTATSTPTQTATNTATATNTSTPTPEQIIAGDGAVNDAFGGSVAIDGNTLVISAPGDDNASADSGSVYVYVRNGIVWSLQQKIMPSDGAVGDFFGRSVAIDGDTLIAGADFDDNLTVDSGSAYIYVRSGTVWTLQQKLVASDEGEGDKFGFSVAISNNTAIISANLDDSSGADSGSAYIYVRSGTVWSLQQKLTASDGATDDYFGYSVSINGDTVVVGTPADDDQGSDSGSAYVFTRSGSVWTQQQKLAASDGAAQDNFGVNVSVDEDTIIIGAYNANGGVTDAGAAYVFTRSGTVWTQQQKIVASDGATGDFFGFTVALNGDRALIGAYLDDDASANSGSAYFFTRSGTVWTQQQKFIVNSGLPFDYFGKTLAMDGTTAVIGAYLDDIGSTLNQGSVWIFELP